MIDAMPPKIRIKGKMNQMLSAASLLSIKIKGSTGKTTKEVKYVVKIIFVVCFINQLKKIINTKNAGNHPKQNTSKPAKNNKNPPPVNDATNKDPVIQRYPAIAISMRIIPINDFINFNYYSTER